ncbi:MAG: hypothetical protein IJ446_07510 [Oscillospiraceae bacterium]|nr:hypothetical protein [Oscillospiraceae bacterium]
MIGIDFYRNVYGGTEDISETELYRAQLLIESVYSNISPVAENDIIRYNFGICAQAEYMMCSSGGASDMYKKLSLGDLSCELSGDSDESGYGSLISADAMAYIDGVCSGLRCVSVNI